MSRQQLRGGLLLISRLRFDSFLRLPNPLFSALAHRGCNPQRVDRGYGLEEPERDGRFVKKLRAALFEYLSGAQELIPYGLILLIFGFGQVISSVPVTASAGKTGHL